MASRKRKCALEVSILLGLLAIGPLAFAKGPGPEVAPPTSATAETNSAAEVIKISRYLTLKSCYTGQKCIGPVAKDLENANVELKMKPIHKGDLQGQTAGSSFGLSEDGIPFKSEIQITKKDGEEGYYIYMMLRSGQGLKRHGKVHTFTVKNLSELKQTILKDAPIATKNGTLQAELVFGPSMKISK